MKENHWFLSLGGEQLSSRKAAVALIVSEARCAFVKQIRSGGMRFLERDIEKKLPEEFSSGRA